VSLLANSDRNAVEAVPAALLLPLHGRQTNQSSGQARMVFDATAQLGEGESYICGSEFPIGRHQGGFDVLQCQGRAEKLGKLAKIPFHCPFSWSLFADWSNWVSKSCVWTLKR
jgi:hypothetical protein